MSTLSKVIFFITCQLLCIEPTSSTSSQSALVRKFSLSLVSRTSVQVQWNIDEQVQSESLFFIVEYGFNQINTDVNKVQVSAAEHPQNYTIEDLQSHTYYRFRLAARTNGTTGKYSPWKTILLDLETYILQAQLPSETKSLFQQALYEVLPLSYVNSKEINSTNIDYESSIVEVFYEIYFSPGVNLTTDQLTDMFARNHAREQTSYVRNIKIFYVHFCGTEKDRCSKYAHCIESTGSYTCQCKDDYIDMKLRKQQAFSGTNCSLNTGKPGDLALSVINRTSVLVQFRSPINVLGTIRGYELDYASLSGEKTLSRTIEIGRPSRYMELPVGGLAAYGLHNFRVRAITDLASGRWSGWKKIRTVTHLFQVVFYMDLMKSVTDYPRTRERTHKEVVRKAKTAFAESNTLAMRDFQIIRSDLITNQTIRFLGYLYSAPKLHPNPGTKQRSAKWRFKRRFLSRIGKVDSERTTVKDVDECDVRIDDCGGNSCLNEVGTYRCKCSVGLIDVSRDFDLLPGRICIVFDAPIAFSISLLDPKTADLRWKIPPQMRKPKLNFWFLVQQQLEGNSTIEELRVDLKDKDFFGENYVVSTIIRNLQMSSIYQFRVAAANIDNIGRYSPWKSIETSSLIFNAKLNLTLVVYTPRLNNRNHQLSISTTQSVRSLVSRVLQKLPQYSQTGNVTFSPGLRDRTFADVYLFFNKKGNVQSKHIQEMFQHNSVFDDELGLDFRTINVTDVDECNNLWNDCSPNASCVNLIPGFSCSCKQDFIDLSAMENKPEGRMCVHQDHTTTTQSTTTIFATTKKIVLLFLQVTLIGDAISPNKIRLRWQRDSGSRRGSESVNYDIQYRVKGLPEWQNVSVAAMAQSLDIVDLRRGMSYQIRAAERRLQEATPHTFYTIPIEIRTDPKAYRIFIQFPEIPPANGVLTTAPHPEKTRLKMFTIDYLTAVFSHPNVRNRYRTVRFGSVGGVSFSPHPDWGVIASAIIYFTSKSREKLGVLRSAYVAGEDLVDKPMPVDFMYISDLNECYLGDELDCSPTSECLNSIGSYACACHPGYLDVGPSIYLLRGRLCLLPNQPLTTAISAATPASVAPSRSPALAMTRETTTSRKQLVSKISALSPVVYPENMVGLLSGKCPKGEKMIHSICQAVSLFIGRINVLKESRNNVSASNLLGKGMESLKTAVEKALDTAFSDIEAFSGPITTRIQTLVENIGIVRAVFVMVVHSDKLRRRRQANIFIDDFREVDEDLIQSSLWRYLNGKFPPGQVKPPSGAAVQFGLKDLAISDVDECSDRLLHDCDITYGQCVNTAGRYRCECQQGTNDVSGDVTNRPGRFCKDQCNPNPCLNGALCLKQPHVGAPECKCTDGFTGIVCSKEVERESNLVVVALGTVAGVLFIFLLCFIVTYRVHKNNKRKERKAKAAFPINEQTGTNTAASFNGGETSRSIIEDDLVDTANDSVQDEVPISGATSNPDDSVNPLPIDVADTNSPPPIPARTTSVNSAGIHSNKSFQAPKRNSANPVTPIHPALPLEPPKFLPAEIFERPDPPQARSDNNNITLLPPTLAVKTEEKRSKDNKKKCKKGNSVIRGRIRRHSDDSDTNFY